MDGFYGRSGRGGIREILWGKRVGAKNKLFKIYIKCGRDKVKHDCLF